VVMGDGEILEVGTHDELLRRGGAYTALHSGQVA
jgi:ATP-binding cassette subfamily B protein